MNSDDLSLSPPILQGAMGSERNWSELRKQVYDNMSAYLTRKEERLKGKTEHAIIEHEELAPDSSVLAEPPDKKVKIGV